MDDPGPAHTSDRSLVRRRILSLGVGVVCICSGIALALQPSDAPNVLARLIGIGLALLAISFLVRGAQDRRGRAWWLNAVVWLGVGVGAMAWPAPTVRGLVIVVGFALLLTGAIDLVAAVVGSVAQRSVVVLGGLTSLALGIAVLSWPTATTLVLSIAVGVRLVVAGAALLAGIRTDGHIAERAPTTERDAASSGWRIAISSVGLVLAVGVATVSVAVNRAQPNEPGAFYDAPGELGLPGTLIRSEIVDPFLDGATARRILYVTSDADGVPITASGLVVVPDEAPPPSGRPVLAFTHGTIGIARRCAPSLLPGEVDADAIPGLEDFLDGGFAVVATDYAGLGSEATTGYLVGTSEAYSTLDSVRAAQQINAVGATPEFIAFGESQGGHAALFTGQLAATYAPELRLSGIAAAAPATDLTALFAENVGTTFGNVLSSYALRSWSEIYGVSLDDVVDAQARPVVDRLAELCIQTDAQMLALLPEAELLKLRFLTAPPWEIEPWSTILEQNTPGSDPIDAPVLITQGEDDPLVLPAVQSSFVDDWCSRGQAIEFRMLPDVGHLDAGHASATAVAAWAANRTAQVEWASTCGSG